MPETLCNQITLNCPISADIRQGAIPAANGITVEEAAALENATIPIGRPAEIAEAVVFLAEPASQDITGTAMPVAGGMAPGL